MADTSQWAHTDPRGFAAAITSGMVRAMPLESGAFVGWTDAAGTMQERAADLRALLLAGAYLFDEMSKRAPREFKASEMNEKVLTQLGLKPDDPGIYLSPRTAADFEDTSTFAGVVSILSAYKLLADRAAARKGETISQSLSLATTGGGAAAPLGGAIPAAAFPVVAVVGIIAGAAALCYVTYAVTDVIDRDLARNVDAQKMVAAAAGATQVIQQHYEADKAAGTKTPLSPQEQAIIDTLNKSISKLSQPGAPAPDKPKGSVTDGLFAGLGTVGVLGIALLAWFVLKGRS